MTATDAFYVYGVVRGGTPPGVFTGVGGMSTAPVELVESNGLAAVASPVSLSEFGDEALELNLKDGAWLEQKVQAHNRVLAAAVGRTTVLPFRFGTIYRGEEHVRAMLADSELDGQLARLDGLVEFGVKAFLDLDALRARLAEARREDGAESGGRAYMQRKLQARALDEDVRAVAAQRASAIHERLAAVAVAARANPVQEDRMVLNGAYLLPPEREDELRSALEELHERFEPDGVTYDLTGPWPPYNFAAEEPE
jgi:hypothetical protein